MKYALLMSFTAAFILYKPMIASANNSVLYSSNFDNETGSAWTVVRNAQWNNPSLPCMNGNSTAFWQFLDGQAGITINSPSCTTEITPKSLDLSSLNSYTISFDWLLAKSTHMDRNFALLWKDANNWIGIKLIDNLVILQAVQDGLAHTIEGSQVNYDFSPNIAYRLEVTYEQPGVFKLSIDDNEIINVNDPSLHSFDAPYSFALQASVGAISSSTTSFDNILVTTDNADPVDERLGVVRVGQGDEPWGSMEYDSAGAWSEGGTTFKDWACALTSAVMIMRYHGITQMPDGTDVNPLTVNNWLLANNGYVNGGLVSFSSISALTKMISAQYATPTLEYSRINENPVAEARLAAANGQPMIVQLPGHFVVSNGSVTSDENDLYIQDPASQKEQLSQLNTTPVSVRRLAPSNVSQRLAIADETVESDVSFLEITADPMTVVTITDAAGNPMAIQPVTDQITNANDPSQVSPTVQLIEIPRPGAGSYVVTTNDSAETKLSTTVKTIAKDGSNNVYEIPEGKQTTQVRIAEDGTSVFETEDKIGFSSLRKLLRELRDSGAIKKERPYQLLDLIASYGESSSEPTEQRLVVAILRKVTNNYNTKSGMTREARKTILAQLEQISKQLKSFSQKPIATAKPAPTIHPSPTAKPSPTMVPKKVR